MSKVRWTSHVRAPGPAATTVRTVLQDSADGRRARARSECEGHTSGQWLTASACVRSGGSVTGGSLGEEGWHAVGVEAGEGGAEGGQVVAATQDGAVGPDDGGAGTAAA